MSDARICDAGHELALREHGGYILRNEPWQVAQLRRVGNVYRMGVDMKKMTRA